MNAPIIRVFALVVALFAVLLLFTSRWTVLDASSLNNNPLNKRTLYAELKIKYGRILADDGTVLARSVPAGGGTFRREYPTGSLFAPAIGYSYPLEGRYAGLEHSDSSDLRGLQTGLSSVFGQLGGSPQVGDDVYTTLDPAAQRVAAQQLGSQAGSVVALDPRTGGVLVMYSNPSYDDNNPGAPCPAGQTDCQLNRATEGQYPPGSTFKIVTLTAALDSGKFTPSSMLNGDSPRLISGVPLENDGNQSWGPQTLTTALTYSINTIFAQLAQDVGRATMTEYMKRFGFYSKPPLDYPPGELAVSRPWSPSGTPYAPGSPGEDIGRIGIGQGGLLVTPLQMAMVASAVADGGRLMVPHMTARVVDPTGATVKTIGPTLYSRVMKPAVAAQIIQMMRRVVEEGTGTPAQLYGISVAGKTGTASIGPPGSNLTTPWFIGIAPVGDPKVAVAVEVDRTQGGYGGTVAAPIAARVIQTLLAEGK